jgi:exonuclease III
MKIANWNIERLEHKPKLDVIVNILKEIRADIVVLTETDSQINLDNYKYCVSTPPIADIAPQYYADTEHRVSIYTNYKPVRQFKTYDRYTTLCIELETEYGNLIVYGTIIGIFGNRHKNFTEDLVKQVADFERLSSINQNLCVAGDFNISFVDNYYYTKFGRDELNKSFANNNIKLLTRNRPECIDHIAISQKFVGSSIIEIEEWNYDKGLSDHKGICVDVKNIDREQN